ncbi:MAG: hypothetical protein K2L60_04830, partial [Bacteroides sp.]|nr:hypothetical protein [Bacteroides sp.]
MNNRKKNDTIILNIETNPEQMQTYVYKKAKEILPINRLTAPTDNSLAHLLVLKLASVLTL